MIPNFERGATTGWHTHTSDQILIITASVGKVANESEYHEVTVSDVVHIKKGENHWHGAEAESTVPHHHYGCKLVKFVLCKSGRLGWGKVECAKLSGVPREDP